MSHGKGRMARNLSPGGGAGGRREASMEENGKGRRPRRAAVCHVDMDAFYASVEQRDRPRLRGRPVLVGGAPEERGVVSAASYEARRFGVRSAMPMAQALRLCPGAVRLAPDFPRYRRESEAIHRIFRDYTPLVEPLSLDEAFLDLWGTEGLFGPFENTAREIKERILRERGLVASVGLAPSKLTAKIASDLDKPDGFVHVPPEKEAAFLAPLPVGRMFGVGPATEGALARAGIFTLGDLAAAPGSLLRALFGERGAELARMARGEDSRPVTTGRLPKGHSRERTFPKDVTSRAFLERCLLEFADQVAWELRRMGFRARVVRLKVRTEGFRTLSRSRKLSSPTDLAGPLYREARGLLRSLGPLPPVRLLGLGAGDLLPGGIPRERDLFRGEEEERERRLAGGIDAIRRKWGKGSILPGRLLEDRGEEEKGGSGGGEDPE